jgi:predicted RND superfamily exporter protein
MKKRLLFILCLALTVSAFAQTKTITNADLEKYRQKRLQAEKDYAENYKRLGLPSPAELQKQNEQSRRELSELAARLEREKEIYAIQPQPIYVIQNVTVNNRRSNYPYFYNYYPYGFFNFRNPRPKQNIYGTKNIIIRPPQPIRPPIFLNTNPNIRQ